MRIRSIKPEFWESESLGRVSREARLLFIGLFSCCDDVGRARASSRLLASRLFPYDEDAFKKLPSWISELENQGCIRLYQVDGESYLDIPKWQNHQKIDKPSASKLPSFDDVREDSRGFEKNSLGTGNREEEQGKEGVPQKHESELSEELNIFRMRIGSWFKRRPETRWSEKEIKLLKEAFDSGFTPEELDLLEQFYLSDSIYKRRDIKTLLNNWNTEIDRSKGNMMFGDCETQQPSVRKEIDWRDSL